jgi:hypothetical protein
MTETCNKKHAWLITIFLAIVGLVVGGTWWSQATAVTRVDERLRIVEIRAAATETAAVMTAKIATESLSRIESKLDKFIEKIELKLDKLQSKP